MADEAAGHDLAVRRFLTTGGFRLALAVTSFLLMEVGIVRSEGSQPDIWSTTLLLNDPIFDAGFIAALVWFGVAFIQIFGRVARWRRSQTPPRIDFQPEAATLSVAGPDEPHSASQAPEPTC